MYHVVLLFFVLFTVWRLRQTNTLNTFFARNAHHCQCQAYEAAENGKW